MQCPQCNGKECIRIRRKWWMHFMPGVMYYRCDNCYTEFPVLLSRSNQKKLNENHKRRVPTRHIKSRVQEHKKAPTPPDQSSDRSGELPDKVPPDQQGEPTVEQDTQNSEINDSDVTADAVPDLTAELSRTQKIDIYTEEEIDSIATLKAMLSTERTRRASAEAEWAREKERLHQRIEYMKNEAQSNASALEQAKREIEKEQKKHAALEESVLLHENATRPGQDASLSNEISALQQEILKEQSMRVEMEAQESQANSRLRHRIAELEQEVHTLLEQKNRGQEQAAKQQSRPDHDRRHMDSLLERTAQLESALQTRESELSGIRSELEAQTARFVGIEQAARDREVELTARIAFMQSQLNEAEDRCRILMKSVEEAREAAGPSDIRAAGPEAPVTVADPPARPDVESPRPESRQPAHEAQSAESAILSSAADLARRIEELRGKAGRTGERLRNIAHTAGSATVSAST